MGRELADEFGLSAGDPDGLDDFMDGIHRTELRGRYHDRDADLKTADGDDLLLPDELDDNLVTHIIGGVGYIHRGPYGIGTELPSVIFHEDGYYSADGMTDPYGCNISTPVNFEWRNRNWYRLDAERMKADGVRVIAGDLVSGKGFVPFVSDYVMPGTAA